MTESKLAPVSDVMVCLYANPCLFNTFPHGSFFVRYYSSLLNTFLRISCATVCSCGIIFVLLALVKAVPGTRFFLFIIAVVFLPLFRTTVRMV